MKKNISWDDIPSTNGLGVEWEYKPNSPLGKRTYIRINNMAISKLFAVSEIYVKVVTAKGKYTGMLLDISTGGLSITLPVLLEENLPLKVGFFLGSVKIISKALVRHSRKLEEDQYATGMEFVGLDSESAVYINGLYASLVLNVTY
jgi:hypothetical protein